MFNPFRAPKINIILTPGRCPGAFYGLPFFLYGLKDEEYLKLELMNL